MISFLSGQIRTRTRTILTEHIAFLNEKYTNRLNAINILVLHSIILEDYHSKFIRAEYERLFLVDFTRCLFLYLNFSRLTYVVLYNI